MSSINLEFVVSPIEDKKSPEFDPFTVPSTVAEVTKFTDHLFFKSFTGNNAESIKKLEAEIRKKVEFFKEYGQKDQFIARMSHYFISIIDDKYHGVDGGGYDITASDEAKLIHHFTVSAVAKRINVQAWSLNQVNTQMMDFIAMLVELPVRSQSPCQRPCQSQVQSKNINAVRTLNAAGIEKPILASPSSSLDSSSNSLRSLPATKHLVGSSGGFLSAISNLFSFVSLNTAKKQNGKLVVNAEKETKPLLRKETKVNVLKHEQKS